MNKDITGTLGLQPALYEPTMVTRVVIPATPFSPPLERKLILNTLVEDAAGIAEARSLPITGGTLLGPLSIQGQQTEAGGNIPLLVTRLMPEKNSTTGGAIKISKSGNAVGMFMVAGEHGSESGMVISRNPDVIYMDLPVVCLQGAGTDTDPSSNSDYVTVKFANSNYEPIGGLRAYVDEQIAAIRQLIG